MTVNEKLQALKNAKTSIEQVIIAKGGDLTGKNITQYGEAIAELPIEVTSFEGIKEFASLAAAKELKNYNTIGAVLSLDNGIYKAWNGNPNQLEWNFNAYVASCADDKYEQNKSEMCGCYFINSWASDTPEWPSDTHGTPIAVCVGKGLWAKLDWSGLTNSMMWATNGSNFYNNFIPEAFGKDGEKITVEVLKRHDLKDSSPLFSAVKTAGDVFVPSAFQCKEIWDNLAFLDTNHNNQVNFRSRLCCAIKYVPVYYWSSSQCTNATDAYSLYQIGYIYDYYKDSSYRSFACLRFGA